jgi:hypothetical protein
VKAGTLMDLKPREVTAGKSAVHRIRYSFSSSSTSMRHTAVSCCSSISRGVFGNGLVSNFSLRSSLLLRLSSLLSRALLLGPRGRLGDNPEPELAEAKEESVKDLVSLPTNVGDCGNCNLGLIGSGECCCEQGSSQNSYENS